MANYTKTITIRCTPEQLKVWSEKAKTFDLSINQFIRLAANTLLYTERPILARYMYGESNVIKEPQANKKAIEEK